MASLTFQQVRTRCATHGSKWTPHIIHTGDEHHDGAIIVDIDGDGDNDVISLGWSHPRVLLYENKAIDR